LANEASDNSGQRTNVIQPNARVGLEEFKDDVDVRDKLDAQFAVVHLPVSL
jgi:hypothetical protein